MALFSANVLKSTKTSGETSRASPKSSLVSEEKHNRVVLKLSLSVARVRESSLTLRRTCSYNLRHLSQVQRRYHDEFV